MNTSDRNPVRFYFALPRALTLLFGGNGQRSESNGLEATIVGGWIYSVHYLFFATNLMPLLSTRWLLPIYLVAIAILIWPLWLLLIYLNSLMIKFLRLFGLFGNLPIRRAQNILWGVVTTVMAGDVLRSHPLMWQLALFWLLAVVLNLFASLALSFTDAARGFDE